MKSSRGESSRHRQRVQLGSADDFAEPRFLVIGRILKPHGVRGEVRVQVHTDWPERFEWLQTVYLGLQDPTPVAVESVRSHKPWVLLKLRGVDDRDAAERIRSHWLQVPVEDAVPLQEGEYFLYQLIGLEILSDEGEELGTLSEVVETGANNVFVVRGRHGEILLPDTSEVIRHIDFEKRRMTVHLLPGLIE